MSRCADTPANTATDTAASTSGAATGAPDESSDEAQLASEQMRVRHQKRARLLDSQDSVYPVQVSRTHTLASIQEGFGHLQAGDHTDEKVAIAGRVMFIRLAGKLAFVTLQEGDGTRLQVMMSAAQVGVDRLADFKTDIDLGDFVAVEGTVGVSKRGELSVMADSWQLASKALRPLPVLHKEMNEESRVRQRYVDLIVRPQARQIVRIRSAATRALRDFLHSLDFIEVETPMLQNQHGGAAARPFQTHSNAFDTELYLRIAPELFLKRCLVGGIEKVFEINRNFRNEGSDSSHSPEFTMIEIYQAYGTYDTIAELTREMIQHVARAVCDSTTVTLADGSEYDLGGSWDSITMYGSLSQQLGEEINASTPMQRLTQLADAHQVSVAPHDGPGKIAEELFEALVVPTLYLPTFVRDYPEETSPLTRSHRTTPGVTEKWDLYMRSFELGTGYSELIDPVIQRQRLTAQAALGARGDAEAMPLDEDFLQAMEYGMPPAGGMGMGVDRLLMALTGLGIRETITFPLVKPHQDK